MRFILPPLYAILDAVWLNTSDLPACTGMALDLADAGVELLQYRDKAATSRQLFETASALAKTLGEKNAGKTRLILNDRPDIALLSGSSGVHVGQLDLGVEEARALVGSEHWVGVSTHTLEQLQAADRTSADYIAFGPIFRTATKERPDPLVGLAGLAAARAHTRKPLVAIGGITLENAAETYAAGADSLAVARDLLTAANPGARAKAYLEVAARAIRTKGGTRG